MKNTLTETNVSKLRNQLTPLYSLAQVVIELKKRSNDQEFKDLLVDLGTQALNNQKPIHAILTQLEIIEEHSKTNLKQYENKIITKNLNFERVDETKLLNDEGRDGWQFVQVFEMGLTNRYFFKRELKTVVDFSEEQIRKAVKHIQTTYCEKEAIGYPFLLLGDVAELVKILANYEPSLKEMAIRSKTYGNTSKT